MKALTALACIPFGSYRRNNSLFTKSLMAYNSHVMQSIGMGLCVAYTSIYDLYTCQDSDGSLVKQASSSGFEIVHNFDS